MDREKMSVMDLTVPCVCCGHENTLYDLSDGFCLECDADMVEEKINLMKVLLSEGVYFDCRRDGTIPVPEEVIAAKELQAQEEAKLSAKTFMEERISSYLQHFVHKKLFEDDTYFELEKQYSCRIGTADKERLYDQEDTWVSTGFMIYLISWIRDNLSQNEIEASVREVSNAQYLMSELQREASEAKDLREEAEIAIAEAEKLLAEIEAAEAASALSESADAYQYNDGYNSHTYDLCDLYCIDDLDDIDPELDEFISEQIMLLGGDPSDPDTRERFIRDPFDFEDEDDFDPDDDSGWDPEDLDDIDLEMDEFVSDEIMFRGGNPFDLDTRDEFLSDPFNFGDDSYDD